MQTCDSIPALRALLSSWRAQGESIAFVPTMGNLHEGHISLVRHARTLAPRVVASIFVNPLQFGPNEDFQRYPRTERADADALRAAGVDALFLPSVEAMYPRPMASITQVEVPGISNELCGAFRPGHFRGVATVVARLFNIVQPNCAIFGEKDFQQLFIIRRMVEDLAFPVDIIGMPTVREPGGLAMSSRNAYLTAEQRAQAGALYALLDLLARSIEAGRQDYAAIENEGAQFLINKGLRVDYVAVRRVSDLAMPASDERGKGVILVAAWLGSTRLIDNRRVTLGLQTR